MSFVTSLSYSCVHMSTLESVFPLSIHARVCVPTLNGLAFQVSTKTLCRCFKRDPIERLIGAQTEAKKCVTRFNDTKSASTTLKESATAEASWAWLKDSLLRAGKGNNIETRGASQEG